MVFKTESQFLLFRFRQNLVKGGGRDKFPVPTYSLICKKDNHFFATFCVILCYLKVFTILETLMSLVVLVIVYKFLCFRSFLYT
jgi:hypothetical protein